MRLMHCRLESVRRHRLLELRFSPRITLIAGANESGKSSLVEAMHRALFLRASATGAPIQALRSKHHAGHPLVELGFEAAARPWTLQKRFSGASGTVQLLTPGQQALLGSAAEERLAQLLGVEESLGSRQANRQLPGRWSHLWVMQGEAGRDLLAQGTEHYDLAALIEGLEAKAEGALQSPLDQRLHDQLETLVQASTTSRGVRTNSALWHCLQATAAAREALQEAIQQRQGFEQSAHALDGLLAEIALLEARRLPDLQRRIQQQRQRIALLQALEPLRLKRERLARNQARLRTIESEQRRHAERLRQLDALLAQEERERDQTRAELQQRSINLQSLEQQRQHLEDQGQRLRRHDEIVSLLQRSKDLEGRLAARQVLDQQRQQLQERLQHLGALTPADLLTLREQTQALEAIRIRCEAMATRVLLLRSSTPVDLGGEPLLVGEERLLSQPFELKVGNAVALQLTPGAGSDLAALERERRERLTQLQQMFNRHGLNSLQEAEVRMEERRRLEEEIRLIDRQRQHNSSPDDHRVTLVQLRQRLADLQRQTDQATSCLGADDTDDKEELPSEPELLHQALERCRIQYRSLQESSRGLLAECTKLNQLLAHREQTLQQHQLQRERVLAELCSGQKQHQELVEDSGDLDALERALQALSQEEESLRQHLQAVETDQALGEAQQQLTAFEAEEQRLRQTLQQLCAERGALQERCQALGHGDPYAAEESASYRLEQAEAQEHSARLLVEAQQLLLQEFQRARSDLSARYTLPLQQSIDVFLAPLLGPDRGRSNLAYDAKHGLGGFGLERDGLSLPFDALSGGMREQLNAGLRLAIADVLREGHDGSLPVLFDDAFTNSDPQRLQGVLAMLEMAAARGLQVIVMSCDPDPYRAIADMVVELPEP